MKIKFFPIVFFSILLTGIVSGQTGLNLSFTGIDNWQHIHLNKVEIKNLDKLCDTTLYWPDTVLSLNTLGINDLYYSNRRLQVFQNTPNPVEERTSIKIYIPARGNVQIQISDLSGRSITSLNQELEGGTHVFIFTPGNGQTYLFTAIYKKETRTIKIISGNRSVSNECSLMYQGTEGENTIRKSSFSPDKFLFSLGDSLEMTGYYSDFTSILNDNPTTSKNYTFTFSSTSPIVKTSSVTNITQTTATGGGNVTSEGGTVVTAKGVCWSTSTNPTTDDNKTLDGGGIGEFVSFLTGLTANNTYYVRAYATNSTGTSYGLQKAFTTLAEVTIPSVITAPISNITNVSAQSGGTVTNDGGATVVARGVCWSTENNPTIMDAHTSDGTGTGGFVSLLTGLSPTTFYYVRAYATNSAGTAYGNQQTFSTLENPILPIVTTAQVINITTTNATSGGNVASDGGVAVTARGVCWSASPYPTTVDSHTIDGSGSGPFVSNLTNLTANTLYYIRAYATNSVGTAYGNLLSFTTLTTATFPTVTTDPATTITQTSATSGGNVTSDGGATVTMRGICWSTSSNPTTSDNYTTDGSGTGTFVSYLTGLSPTTLYYVRAYAVNSIGTAYGNEITFTTLQYNWQCGDTVQYEGKTYITVLIGTQCWFKENLNFQSGNSWCYDDNSTNCDTYGRLYDWQTALTVCPSGWHLPSDEEWTTLTTFLGGESVAGGKMKEAGNTHWDPSSICNTNESGFTALPGGMKMMPGGSYSGLTTYATFWSSSEYYISESWDRWLWYGGCEAFRNYYNKLWGHSVRCLRDNQNLVLPTVYTTSVTNISTTTATSGGNVTSDGGATVTARGVCWSTSSNPTISDNHTTDGSGTGTFTSYLTGLTPNTLYYVRAYAINSVGTAYGSEITFTTLSSFTCGDILTYEGITYTTIQIGTQCWFKENLNIGMMILGIQNQTNNSIIEKYCYNDIDSNCDVYGGLYQWDEMMQYSTIPGIQGICPGGWHIPTAAEWSTLMTFLGGESFAGGKMKETGTVHWAPPNTGATNSSGFTGLPGGARVYLDGSFCNITKAGYFWLSSENDTNDPYYARLFYASEEVLNYFISKLTGNSIRCLNN